MYTLAYMLDLMTQASDIQSNEFKKQPPSNFTMRN